jgi:hypothetical protein
VDHSTGVDSFRGDPPSRNENAFASYRAFDAKRKISRLARLRIERFARASRHV